MCVGGGGGGGQVLSGLCGSFEKIMVTCILFEKRGGQMVTALD